METIVGIFPTREAAVAAAQELRSAGIAEEQLTLTEPQSSLAETSSIPPPQSEAPGACGANAENVQGAILGFAGGILGSTILMLALPGIGPIAAVGALGLSGAMGSLAGGVFGQAARESTAAELKPQEFFTYEHALRQGKHLLVVQHNGETTTQTIAHLLARNGAEEFNEACDQWWNSLRREELEGFAGSPEEFTTIERRYRDGFEAALAAFGRKSTGSDTAIPAHTPGNTIPQDDAFERGYERGRQYYEAMLRRYAKKEEESAKSV